jgi:hypothetical protein
MTRLRIGFMPVDSFKFDGLAVNAEETAALFTGAAVIKDLHGKDRFIVVKK